jgi:ABC-type nitrate/sulfonate/bicarbonate transport system permease component
VSGRTGRLPAYVAVVVLAALAWALARGSAAVSPLLVPAPGRVADSVWTKVICNSSALWITLVRAVVGTALGLALGALLAIVSFLSPAVEPLVRVGGIVMRCVPVTALAPVIAVLVGYGGPGAVVTTTVMSFFPAYTLVGGALWRIPRSLADLVRVAGGRRWLILRHVGLPIALAELTLAAKLTSCLAVLATLTAEFLTANDGLGALLARSQGLLDTPTVWAILLTSLVSSFVCYELMDLLERKVRDRLSLHRA